MPESNIDVSKLNEDNKSCVIYLEDFTPNDKVIFLPCFHFFHSKCIRDWTKKQDNCPFCKLDIKSNMNIN